MFSELQNFILQSQTNNLKTSSYQKEYSDLDVKVSFGMGTAAKISWISVHNQEIRSTKGINCVYLYFKKENILILAYGIMESFVKQDTWPFDILNNNQSINDFFDENLKSSPYRYGDSLIYKSYSPVVKNGKVFFTYYNSEIEISSAQINNDIDDLINIYSKVINIEVKNDESTYSKGLFYMENQLEDFIISNWKNTELGKKYDLIYEEGELKSKQYRTEIGIIDILAFDNKNNCHVVIELKRNQTSDDTVGQLMRYMGWVKRHLKDENVKGIIIAGKYDKKLDYALEYAPFDTDVFIYNVTFELNEFSK
tara:strand:- start:1231 stop:2160 length:930 start_codon:yes stop_codon:yes gene_type:complete